MSEYQYYEFAAIDRPLDPDELAEVRALSTRAHITPTSFVNEYQWGDFRGDPGQLLERYYDAFLYLANWGTRQLMLRFPAALLDLSIAQRYCADEATDVWSSDEHVVVAVVSEDEEGDFEWGGEGVLSSLLPVRSEIVAGDLRALYLMWLVGIGNGTVGEDEPEPPVPPGLSTLTGSQTALAEFLRIDRDLLAAAASGSAATNATAGPDVEGWVAGLPAGEREALLVALLRGDDAHLRMKTLRQMGGAPIIEEGPQRTAGELDEAAAARRGVRERAEADRRARDAAENARLAAEARRKRLDELASEGDRAWDRVATHIAEKKPVAYDVAVHLLADLRDVTDNAEFGRRVEDLKVEHRRKPAFIERLAAAGL
jgi:hypothetical protein